MNRGTHILPLMQQQRNSSIAWKNGEGYRINANFTAKYEQKKKNRLN